MAHGLKVKINNGFEEFYDLYKDFMKKKGLKSILRALNFVLHCTADPHEAATGFVPDRSIVDNAERHVGHHYVLNLDLKDFFHIINVLICQLLIIV